MSQRPRCLIYQLFELPVEVGMEVFQMKKQDLYNAMADEGEKFFDRERTLMLQGFLEAKLSTSNGNIPPVEVELLNRQIKLVKQFFKANNYDILNTTQQSTKAPKSEEPIQTKKDWQENQKRISVLNVLLAQVPLMFVSVIMRMDPAEIILMTKGKLRITEQHEAVFRFILGNLVKGVYGEKLLLVDTCQGPNMIINPSTYTPKPYMCSDRIPPASIFRQQPTNPLNTPHPHMAPVIGPGFIPSGPGIPSMQDIMNDTMNIKGRLNEFIQRERQLAINNINLDHQAEAFRLLAALNKILKE